jgi:hypothetical protein
LNTDFPEKADTSIFTDAHGAAKARKLQTASNLISLSRKSSTGKSFAFDDVTARPIDCNFGTVSRSRSVIAHQ